MTIIASEVLEQGFRAADTAVARGERRILSDGDKRNKREDETGNHRTTLPVWLE